ncbi:MAG: hypothetical protein OEZ32_07495 [Nitrospinota bacterium]|nr:hypothetical protein [Nitrospinota bacterium]
MDPSGRRKQLKIILCLALTILAYLGLARLPDLVPKYDRIASLEDEWTGEYSRVKEGMIAGDGKRSILIFREVKLKKDGLYLFRVNAENSPGFNFGFSRGAVSPLFEKFSFPATNTILSSGNDYPRYYVADSGGVDGNAALRISFRPGHSISIRSFEVYETFRYYQALYFMLLAVMIGATLGAFWIWEPGGPGFMAALLFIVTLMAYKATVVVHFSGGDNAWYIQVARNILCSGNTNLDNYFDKIRVAEGIDINASPGPGRRLNYYTYQGASGSIYNVYPLGVSLAILPVVALEIPMGMNLLEMIKLTAMVLAAGSVALMFLAAIRVGASYGQSLVLSLTFAFATTQFSHHAPGVWSHSVTLALSLLSVLLLLRKSAPATMALAPLTALGVASRPDYIFFAACFAAYIFWSQRRLTIPYIILSLLFFAPTILWNISAYGSAIPPYYQNQTNYDGVILRIMERLFSPNRGLFIFNPIFIFSLFGTVLVWLKKGYHPIYRMAGACFLLHTIFTALISGVGGYAYGPRLNAAALGFMVILLIPAWEYINTFARPLRRAVSSIALCFVFWGFFVHLKGVVTWEPYLWNRIPCDVLNYPKRVWDWQDMQVFRTEQINKRLISGEVKTKSCPR